ncbi:MAG: hypothetical protein ABWX84_02165 [Nocardioides sp.]
MRIEDVRDLLAVYDDVREKGTSAAPGWYVDNRLVARQLDGDSVLVRADFDARERLLDDHPDTFSVPPSMEAHRKVVVELVRADPEAVRRALAEAVELQRDR